MLQSKLEKHGIDAYVDTTRTDSTKVRFPERLMEAIEITPVFICLLGERDGEHTLRSDWVLKEIQRAYELGKFCIPVFQESYRPLANMPDAVDYLLSFDGIHILDQKNIMIDESVNRLVNLIRPHKKKLPIKWIIACLLLLLGMSIIALWSQSSKDNSPNPLATEIASIVTADPITSSTPTLSGFQQLSTTEAELRQSVETQIALDLTATESFVSANNATSTAQQFEATETVAFATLLALSATPTPTNTYTPTPNATATLIAFRPQTNADWTPIEHEFDGVPMVLVPVGCFMMGSDAGKADEKPVHEQCFDEPFWIDKYEVTQAQFTRLGGVKANNNWFTGDNRPIERITWFEARDFCELRGGRLPTEAEWEYAARGVDGLIYPWGNEWNANNAVWNRSSEQGTTDVGSIPDGKSWIGAYDMSGNVWEWTSSLYESYPYDRSDGRERDTGDSTDVRRVLRGGSWNSGNTYSLRAPNRGRYDPDSGSYNIGVRCVLPTG